MAIPFTQIPEVDIKTLLYLPDQDLLNVCQTNVYASQLCQDDYFWQQRILDRLDDKYLQNKPEEVSWRDWYFFWRNNYPDPIGDRLNLDTNQAMIRIITTYDVIAGSEAFQNISLTLKKAFQSRDPQVVSYFMAQFEKIKDLFFNHDLNFEDRFLDYADVISAAFKNGFVDEATRLLDVMNEDIERLSETSYHIYNLAEDYDKIIETLGRLGMTQYLDDVFMQHSNEYFLTQDVISQNFILGLIEGGYQDEAYQRLERYLTEDDFNIHELYKELINPAIAQNATQIIDLLDTYSQDVDPPVLFARLKEMASVRHQGLTGLQEDVLSPELVYSSLLAGHHYEEALNYLKQHPNEITMHFIDIKTCYRPFLDYIIFRKRYFDLTGILQSCPLDIILETLDNPEITYDLTTVTIVDLLKKGRYDVAIALNRIIKLKKFTKEQRREFWENIVEALRDTYYKDLYLYLILRYLKLYPSQQNFFLRPPFHLVPNNVENYLLLQGLAKIPPGQLAATNFHDLLIQPYM